LPPLLVLLDPPELPEFGLPDVELPEFGLPDVPVGDVVRPEVPVVEPPEFTPLPEVPVVERPELTPLPDVPAVPLPKPGLRDAPVDEAPLQLADSIRADETRTCWTPLSVSAEPDVPATLLLADAPRRDDRAFAREAGFAGTIIPVISTCWPTWLVRSIPSRTYDELPDALALEPLVPAAPVVPTPAPAVDDEPLLMVAFESVNILPNVLLLAERDDREAGAPVVPLVPTAAF